MKLIYMIFLLSFCFSKNYQSNDIENETFTREELFKEYVASTLPGYLFFGPYSFNIGVNLGGSSISNGGSSRKANSIWLATPLLAGFLIRTVSKDIVNNVLQKPTVEDQKSTFYYNIYYVGPDISSIKNVSFESIDDAWNANIDEVSSTFDYPSLGFRTGFSTDKFGMDYEMSLSGHHTKKERIIYEYNSPQTGVVPLEQEIPSHFYMLHSMYIGLNTYYVMPDFILTPYLGAGSGLLLNSVQSEYPGPADLAREGGSLALDETSINLGVHSFFGFRLMKKRSFYYIEGRYAIHNFDSKSGTLENRSIDTFGLESFQLQFGIGTSLFK